MTGTHIVIAPVAGIPQDGLAAVAVLPDQDHDAVGGREGREVQDDGFERQQQRAKRASEQHERRERDQGKHHRKAAVHVVAEVQRGGARAGDAEHPGIVGQLRADRADRVLSGGDIGLRGWEHRDQLRPVSAELGRGRGDRGVHAGQLRESARDGGRDAPAGEDVDRSHRAGGDAAGLERAQRFVRATCLCQRGGGRLADVHRQRGDDQRGEGGGARQRGQPPVAGGEPCPRGPAAAGAVLGAQPRPLQPRADASQDDGEQGERDGDRDQRDQDSADTGAAQERDGQDDECEQPDADRQPGEQDGAAGGRHRGVNGLVALATVRALLTPASDDEQRVVDRDAEADQRDQELDDLADTSDVREGAQRQEGGEDRRRARRARRARVPSALDRGCGGARATGI
jgi:hypothetical protein